MNSPHDMHESWIKDQSGSAAIIRFREIDELIFSYEAKLPPVEPIGDFIHYNPLQSWLHMQFKEALRGAHELFGSRQHMPLDFYRRRFKEGAIAELVIETCIRDFVDQKFTRDGESNPSQNPSRNHLYSYIKSLMLYGDRLYDPAEIRTALKDLSEEKKSFIATIRYKIEQKFDPCNVETGALKEQLAFSSRVKEAHDRLSTDVRRPLRELWTPFLGEHVDWLVNPIFYRLIATFLDQGISSWECPGTDRSFYSAAHDLIQQIPAFKRSQISESATVGNEWTDDSARAIASCLHDLVGDSVLWPRYVREMIRAYPGWCSLFVQINHRPERLRSHRQVSLKDLLAVRLEVEARILRDVYQVNEKISSLLCSSSSTDTNQHGLIDRRFNSRGNFSASEMVEILTLDVAEMSNWTMPSDLAEVIDVALTITDSDLEFLWHQSFEQSFYNDVISKVVPNALRLAESEGDDQGANRDEANRPERLPSAQLIFCLDDRECSMRRHVEQLDPDILTYGMAGFFNIDMMFLGAGKTYPEKYCPVPVKPGHIVIEDSLKVPRRLTIGQSKFLDFLTAPGKLSGMWLRPIRHAQRQRLSLSPMKTSLHFRYTGSMAFGYRVGYTADEMTDRVEMALRSMGMIGPFAPVVLVVAHGSSAMNNPYYAAYECAACSGRPGGVNARVFSAMANDCDVRRLLFERGIQIPASTHFIGAFHDTANEEFRFFDTESLSGNALQSFTRLKDILITAAGFNAVERCARFENVSVKLSPRKALREVKLRSSAMFEPRAELGHATNAACVIGRRSLTRGISLDRRSFLASYDPTLDQDGKYLGGILGAAIPVCGGVSLDYFFSRIDNAVFGSGSKLAHNVVGMVGVLNGLDDDLRMGLPTQMIELHDPLRIIFVIDQKVSIVRSIIDLNHELKLWVDNNWVRVVCLDPDDGSPWLLTHGGERKISHDEVFSG